MVDRIKSPVQPELRCGGRSQTVATRSVLVLIEHRLAPQRMKWSQPMVTLHPNPAYDAGSLT
jgi:hypothetical protein